MKSIKRLSSNLSLRGEDAAPVTRHAWARMHSRRIRPEAIRAAILYGRIAHVRGARIYAVGRRDVLKYRREQIVLDQYEGVQVVCAPDGTILTAYRNRNFKALRPRR